MLDKKKNLNFIHIPRTAGTYIENYLHKQIYNNYENINFKNTKPIYHFLHENKNDNPEGLDGYHITLKDNPNYKNNFCVIRDPFEQRKSVYKYMKNLNNYQKSFDEYIQSNDFKFLPRANNILQKENKTYYSKFGLPQTDYIELKKNYSNIDTNKIKIFIFEDGIDPVLNYIDKIYKRKIPRDKNQINKSSKEEINMSAKTEYIIRNYYKRDFELIKKLNNTK